MPYSSLLTLCFFHVTDKLAAQDSPAHIYLMQLNHNHLLISALVHLARQQVIASSLYRVLLWQFLMVHFWGPSLPWSISG